MRKVITVPIRGFFRKKHITRLALKMAIARIVIGENVQAGKLIGRVLIARTFD